jgi:uncharacterized Zn finger protein
MAKGEKTMQAKCPKCGSTAFRMLPESDNTTEVECLNCGRVAPFVSTVAPQVRIPLPKHEAADGE